MKEYNFLFKYLNKEKFIIDQKELLENLKSHPYNNSLLAIHDTLNYFFIENLTFEISFDHIDELPITFISQLNSKNNKHKLYYIERIKANTYKCISDDTVEILNKSELSKRWLKIVLICINQDSASRKKIKKYNFNLKNIFFLISIILVLLLLNNFNFNIFNTFNLILSFSGILLSIIANKTIFELDGNIFEKICSISTKTDCNSVFNSKKIKILEKIKINEISLIYFTSYFFCFFFFSMLGKEDSIIYLLQLLSFVSLFVISLSLYYQKFIEKKWCPICLLISLTLFLLYILSYLHKGKISDINLNSFLIFSIIFSIISFSFVTYKDFKKEITRLNSYKNSTKKIFKNVELFKSSLLINKKNNFNNLPSIRIGSNSNKIEITLITNIDCFFCKDIKKTILYLFKNNDKIKLNIIFNTEIENLNNHQLNYYLNLYNKYEQNSEQILIEMLLRTTEVDFSSDRVDFSSSILDENSKTKYINYIKESKNWCLENHFNFTPALFINGHLYPRSFPRKNINYFVCELLEDRDFI